MSSFEEYYYQNIGAQIRKYRKSAGYTQEQLSEMLSKNYKYIGHIECGERQISNKMIIKLLECLKIQPKDFFKFNEIYHWSK